MSREGLYESITNLLVAIEVTRYQADIAMDVLAKMLETSPIPLNESVKVTKRLKRRLEDLEKYGMGGMAEYMSSHILRAIEAVENQRKRRARAKSAPSK